MEKRNVVILALIIIITLLLFYMFYTFILSENGDNPFIPNGNGEPDIERTEWAFEITEINDMNDDGYKGEGVIVGIVDSGMDPEHPDLDHINVTAWLDTVNNQAEPYDDNGHGTMMAGIIAAKGTIDGVAPDVKMVVVKAISSGGSGTDEDVAEGIQFCVDNDADVICLSLGGRVMFLNLGDDSAQACIEAVNQGVFVVAAAGNDGEDDDGDVSSPAHVEGVIAVGAVDENGTIASFSSIGDNDGDVPGYQWWDLTETQDPNKKPELVAPGVKIISTYPDEKYAEGSGTSQACAFVSGCVALLLEADPEYQREGAVGGDEGAIEDVKDVLMETAEAHPSQDTPHDDNYGYGLIQVDKASAQL